MRSQYKVLEEKYSIVHENDARKGLLKLGNVLNNTEQFINKLKEIKKEYERAYDNEIVYQFGHPNEGPTHYQSLARARAVAQLKNRFFQNTIMPELEKLPHNPGEYFGDFAMTVHRYILDRAPDDPMSGITLDNIRNYVMELYS